MSSIKAHRNVISYERAWQDGGYFYIVMELCQGGNLAKVLESLDCPMSTRRVFSLASGFLAGLEHIHGYKFMHLDLKPDNLFLCDEVGIKIGDFGLCIREDEWEDQEGDRRYLAPEILNSQATCKSDVFSAGLIIFQMLKNLKDLPGNGNDWHLLRQNFSFSASDPGQDGLAQIVGEMIKMDPERRLSSSDALARILSWGSTLTL
ncbi:hypothetical protein GUITHDRAFT_149912 [Guillardia theta CCMP2712]|uniref:Protein kinase domain-containing protein n=2 Tax=Guillardia theta TaxID=55529 RepID=L1K2X3_GUITC|nr:hypothetical protein GUITHDRAFT_149912 [Guillardia theta CCMP2712]EKX54954.1 hypothetical protein GUITHDRAFT_149912 [Guillardia theta CCMP2712]|eukprot:XP_005841934.1 hypothetical protein GUITHDRAFT_149912 [Guillardia theta CCMP2712]